MTENKRIGRNIGRIELLAVQNKVKALLEAGYDHKKIHSRLIDEGGISMSYQTFCYQLKKLLSGAPVSPPSQAPLAKPTSPAKAEKSEPFRINRNPKLEDFV